MKDFETASQAVEWLNLQRWTGTSTAVENTRVLLQALGRPDRRMGKILHVAGTNGKGSTCAYLSGGLLACGYRVGLFTSPYLCRFNERIALDNVPIPDADLIRLTGEVRRVSEELAEKGTRCSVFELLTALACLYYAENHTDYAVMEVGLGGRLDSTNALETSLSLIAAIGLDHMDRLGDTIELIAGEKAGIMRPNVPAAVMRGADGVMDVFESHARDTGTELLVSETPRVTVLTAQGCEFECVLPVSGRHLQRIRVAGEHQAKNAALALTGLDLLGIDMKKASLGVENTLWEGRLQLWDNVLIDCGHNPQGAETLKSYVNRFFGNRRKVLLTGMMRDKQLKACAEIFSSFADAVVCTAVNWPRAISPSELAEIYGGAVVAEGTANALAAARELAGSDGLVIAAGSVYLTGEVLNELKGDHA